MTSDDSNFAKEDIVPGESEVFTYIPGNGTLYKFIVARFPNGASCGAIGATDSPSAFIFEHIGRSGHLFPEGCYLSPHYVGEKLNVHGEDLAATIVALGKIINSQTPTFEELREQLLQDSTRE